MLDRAQALGQIDTALFDSGYFSEGVIRATDDRAIELLCPEGQSLGDDWNKQSDKQFPKSQFEYVAEEDAYRCPNQRMLTPCGAVRTVSRQRHLTGLHRIRHGGLYRLPAPAAVHTPCDRAQNQALCYRYGERRLARPIAPGRVPQTLSSSPRQGRAGVQPVARSAGTQAFPPPRPDRRPG